MIYSFTNVYINPNYNNTSEPYCGGHIAPPQKTVGPSHIWSRHTRRELHNVILARFGKSYGA